MATNVTKDNFKELVLESSLPVVIDFWAPWCGPCKMLVPIIDELADEYKETAFIGKVNVDEQGELASEFGIASIPALVFFKDGEEVKRMVGFKPKQQIIETFTNL